MSRARLAAVALTAAAAAAAAAAGPAAAGSFTLRFDILSPGGITCAATGAPALASRDFAGRSILRVTGDTDAARVTCTAPDGSRWGASLPRHRNDPLAAATEGLVLFRPGAQRMVMLVSTEGRRWSDPKHHAFVRLD